MKIDEVKDHLGEEWACGYHTYQYPGGRFRLDEITTVVEKTWGYRPGTRNVRRVKATRLDPETGAVIREEILEAREIDEPWEGYWARQVEAQERHATLNTLAEKLEAHLGQTLGVTDRSLTLRLTVAEATAMLARLEAK